MDTRLTVASEAWAARAWADGASSGKPASFAA